MESTEPSAAIRGRPRIEGLRQRREDEILNVAAKIFAAKGYADTDIDSIAAAIQAAKGTIYRYFASKRELFFATLKRGIYELKVYTDSRTFEKTDPMERILEAIRGYFQYFDEHPELAELFLQERAHFKDEVKPLYFSFQRENVEPWYQMHRALVATGRIRNIVAPEHLDIVNDMLYGTIIANHVLGRRGLYAEQADAFIRVVFEGLWTDEEKQRRVANKDSKVTS